MNSLEQMHSDFTISFDSVDFRDLKIKRKSELEKQLLEYRVSISQTLKQNLLKHAFFFSFWLGIVKYTLAMLFVLTLWAVSVSPVQTLFIIFLVFSCYLFPRVFFRTSRFMMSGRKTDLAIFALLSLLAMGSLAVALLKPLYTFPLTCLGLVFFCFALAILHNLKLDLEMSSSVNVDAFRRSFKKRDSLSVLRSQQPLPSTPHHALGGQSPLRDNLAESNAKDLAKGSQYTIDLEGDLPSEFNEFRFQFESLTSQSGFLDDSKIEYSYQNQIYDDSIPKSQKEAENLSKKSAIYSQAFIDNRRNSVHAKDVLSNKNWSPSPPTQFDQIDTSTSSKLLQNTPAQLNQFRLDSGVYGFENQSKSKVFTFSQFAYEMGAFLGLACLFLVLLFEVPVWLVLLCVSPFWLALVISGFLFVNTKGCFLTSLTLRRH